MADFCHTSVRQLAVFAAPECDARLLFWKNEKTIINIVVGSFGGAGGAAKLERRSLNVNFFRIGPIVELLFHLLSFFPVCRNVPEPCRNNFENSAAVFKNNPVLGTKPVAGSFVLCRNVPEPCRNACDLSNIRQGYSPIEKKLKILRFL